jgi:hypothetical protein
MLMKPLIVIKGMVGLEKYSESNLEKGYPRGRQSICEESVIVMHLSSHNWQSIQSTLQCGVSRLMCVEQIIAHDCNLTSE